MKDEALSFVPDGHVGADFQILIVGAGHAGISAARELRRIGYCGRIVLYGDEPHSPYERPPLSKAVLLEAGQADADLLMTADELAKLEIVFRPGVRIAELDVERQIAYAEDGGSQAFDLCLLATGGQPRVLTALPAGLPGVHYVRSLNDAKRLGAELTDADSVLVMGGGYLGLEVASCAISLGKSVTLLDVAPQILSRGAPEILSEWLEARCRHMGIRMLLGKQIASISHETGRYSVTLSEGETLCASVLVVAIGQQPNTQLAADVGAQIDSLNGGVVVDEQCRTSIPCVYAAGDCVSQYHPWYGKQIRLESWQSANEQGVIAARSMLGKETQGRGVPWFWTDVLGSNIQLLGSAPEHGNIVYLARTVFDPCAERPQGVLLGISDSRLVHAVAVNAGGDLRALRPLLERHLPVDVDMLLDASKPLRTIAKKLLETIPVPEGGLVS